MERNLAPTHNPTPRNYHEHDWNCNLHCNNTTTTIPHLTRLREETQHTRRIGYPYCHDTRLNTKRISTQQHAKEIRNWVVVQRSLHQDSTYNKMIHQRGDPNNIQDAKMRGHKAPIQLHFSQHVLFHIVLSTLNIETKQLFHPLLSPCDPPTSTNPCRDQNFTPLNKPLSAYSLNSAHYHQFAHKYSSANG